MSVLTACGCGSRSALINICGKYLPQRHLASLVSNRKTKTSTLQRSHQGSRVASTSIIYSDPYETGNVAVLEVDLDLTSRFRDLKRLHENVRLRKLDDINVYHVAVKHKNLSDVAKKRDQLETDRDEVSRDMNHHRKQEQTEARVFIQRKLRKQGREIRDDLKKVNRYYYELEKEVMSLGLELPVDLHHSTPELDDRIEKVDDGKLSRKSSRIEPLSHITIGKNNGTIVEKNVGPTRYYLTDELALLEQDLTHNVTQSLTDEGFTQMACPNIIKTVPVEASGICIEMPDKVYILKDKDIAGSAHADITWNRTRYLSGVSPQGFIAFLTKMNFQDSTLPLKYFSVGKNYNPSRSHQDLGLFTTAEATVVELLGVAVGGHQVDTLYSQYQDVAWRLCHQLCPDLPKRLVAKEPKSLALTEAARVDLEVWSPYLREYVVVGSMACWSDFVARRVMAKWSPNVDKVLPTNYVHTVHGTALNLTTMIGLIMEAQHVMSET